MIIQEAKRVLQIVVFMILGPLQYEFTRYRESKYCSNILEGKCKVSIVKKQLPCYLFSSFTHVSVISLLFCVFVCASQALGVPHTLAQSPAGLQL